MNSYGLGGKVAVITGGASGTIGLQETLERTVQKPVQKWNPLQYLELELPRDSQQELEDNPAQAAIALGLSLLGFVLPLVSAIAHSANVWDCLIWSVIALIVQIIVYYIVKIPVPNLSARIAAGELAAAIWLGLASLAAGALNAASMIY